MRRVSTGMDPVRAGVIAMILIAIFSYFAFTKDLPFSRGYRIQAVFQDSNLVLPRTPVRIAGVDVGKIVEVGRYKDTHLSVVTMEIKDNGRPIHSDATIKIRPRMFLEGNFYLDLEPGTPDATEIRDGGIIPVSQTARPVQLDQVLTGLQSDTRESLQQTIRGLGTAFSSKPTPEDDADQDPDVRGLTGAQALNKALDTSVGALRDSAIANDALLGDDPHDMSRLIEGIARTSSGLGKHEQALRDLVSDFNTTMAAMASRAPELSETVRLLGPTAANARLGFASIERALPPSSAFARELIPGVEETPATIAASGPWLTQAEKLFGPAELGGLLGRARARHPPSRGTGAQAARVPARGGSLQSLLHRRAAADREPARGRRAVVGGYRELQGVLVLDGGPGRRGAELRRQRHVPAARGPRRRPDDRVRQDELPGRIAVRQGHHAAAPHPAGVPRQPAAAHARRSVPPQPGPRRERPGVDWARGRLATGRGTLASATDLRGAEAMSMILRKALRYNAKAGVALILLVLASSAVGGYILANQRLNYPAWIPVIGEKLFKLEVELDTGQGVLPGQGQAVNVSGVRVGDIAGIELEDGKAIATLNIQERFARVYPDASALLRPKTGVKDMIMELDPGTPSAGPKLESGARIRLDSSQIDINFADFLAHDGRRHARLPEAARGRGG